MHTKPAFAIVTLFLVLSGCTSAASPSTAGAPQSAVPASQGAVVTLTASAVPQSTPSPAASPSEVPSANTGQVSIDPCTLLTVDQASATIGKKLSAGVSDQVDQLRVCTFKSGLTELKVFLAPPAPDAATAQAYWDAERAQVPADMPVKDLTVFDRSAFGAGSAGGISVSGLFVIDGTTFFEVYCGFPGCTETKSVAAAQFIAGNLP